MKTAPFTLGDYLIQEFESRCKKNQRYSIRAFARTLGVSASNLSKAMKGKRGFTPDTVQNISKKLGLSSQEKKLLLNLRAKEFSRSPKARREAAAEIKNIGLYPQRVNLDQFELIANWYSIPILALTDMGIRSKAEMATRLDIHPSVVDSAVERLKSVGAILGKDGDLRSSGQFFVNAEAIPSRAVRTYHRQMLEKAIASLDQQSVEERDFCSIVIPFNPEKMKTLKEKIKKFRESIEAEFGAADSAQEVYALGLQFFKLTSSREKTSPNT